MRDANGLPIWYIFFISLISQSGWDPWDPRFQEDQAEYHSSQIFFFFENKKPKDPHANKKELEHFQPLKCIPVVELTIPKGMARDTCNQDRMHDALRVDLAKLTWYPKPELKDLNPFLFHKNVHWMRHSVI